MPWLTHDKRYLSSWSDSMMPRLTAMLRPFVGRGYRYPGSTRGISFMPWMHASYGCLRLSSACIRRIRLPIIILIIQMVTASFICLSLLPLSPIQGRTTQGLPPWPYYSGTVHILATLAPPLFHRLPAYPVPPHTALEPSLASPRRMSMSMSVRVTKSRALTLEAQGRCSVQSGRRRVAARPAFSSEQGRGEMPASPEAEAAISRQRLVLGAVHAVQASYQVH